MQSSIAASNANPTQATGEVDIVILGEGSVSYGNPVGNFIIPGLTPSLSSGATVASSTPKRNPKNIINNDTNDFGLAPVTKSNFIQLTVPKYLFTVLDVKVTGLSIEDHKVEVIRQTYQKGQQFLAIYLGQNRERPMIIGVI